MTSIILAVIYSSISILFVLLIRSYGSLSIREAKRQARAGSLTAKKIYTIRARYGLELWLVLWMFVGIFSAMAAVVLARQLWDWLAFIIAAILLIVAQVVLPKLRRPANNQLAARSASAVDRVLALLHPVTKHLARLLSRYLDDDPFWQAHSKDELIEALDHSAEADSSIEESVRIATSALTFGDKFIGSVMTPRSVMKTVGADEVMSPVVLGELHDSGFSRFPMLDKEKQYVGILYLKDAVEIRGNKTIAQVARPQVFFVNEAATLESALKAFLKTKHHLFLVVNEFEDVVGLITIEDVIEQIIGKKIVDEFDQYDDLRAVAKSIATDTARAREKSKQNVA